jgi:putative SOS response-associated peptidase YedK
MPVILDRTHFDQWLDPKQQDPEALAPLLRPFPADWKLGLSRPAVDERRTSRRRPKEFISAS